jgi:signal transduction histidine kinase
LIAPRLAATCACRRAPRGHRRSARGAEKDVTVVVDAADDLLAAIGPDALRAIVGNLADNAVKHMPSDGAERLVHLRAERIRDEVRIRVRDTGAGIAAAALPRLFEPFFRGTDRPGGFGIGLKTVKRLVDAHRGRISVVSEEGAGSEFTVTLPAAPGAGPLPATGAAAASR